MRRILPSPLLSLPTSPFLPPFREAHTKPSDAPSAYAMLERYDFPRGILPEGVQSYLLKSDGSFDLYLGSECEFKVQGSYVVRYKRKITGSVETDLLKDLKGVSVKVLFIWLGVTEVQRSGDQLRFYVGPLSSSFPIANFEECPKCRCGFDCSTALLLEA